ncbi:MAG: thiamine biosynthesis lipoprotein ApbE [Myxococcaceae bacterium]|nr:thiamine biosynthesis lipoprotein ApbE [Myxococcaceae bacterium]
MLTLASVLACQRTERVSQASVPEPRAAPDAAPAAPSDEAARADATRSLDGGAPDAGTGPALHKAQRKLMGTLWAVTIAGGHPAMASAAAERALDEVARLETILSEWRPDSDISRVNQQAGIAPVHVSPELVECVRASLEVARWSHGAFDISWAALRGLWDFSADSPHVPPSPAQVKALLPLWNYRNIVLDEKNGTVFLKKKGMQIGLGGVAKGYALDRAGELLQAAGLPNYLMYAGGQVLVHGKRGERAWRVGIQHPREPRHFAFVEIEDGSLATSGDYEHAFTYGGQTYHHIIDPKSGFPSQLTSSVTLVARSALWADAVDTAIFIMGPTAGLAALKSAPGGPFEAAVVDPKMRLVLSENMRARLIMTAQIEADGYIGAPIAPREPVKSAP